MNDNKSAIGTCGSYCGSCPIAIAYDKGIEYQRKLSKSLSSQMNKNFSVNDVQCKGCRDAAKDRHSWAFRCKIRKCASDKSLKSCAECSDYPCEKLLSMDGIYEGLLIKQLDEYKELGPDKWLELMQERWKCPKCAEAIESSTKKCGVCNIDCSQHVNATFEQKKN